MSAFINPPTKPPRGVKQPRESSGLLMSVIRTLSASESNEQRDREKAKLEKEYKKSDKRLDELVSLNDEDLNQVMQSFEKVSSNVLASRDKIRSVKENLIACKMLLRCKREELKKLWLEGVEQKYTLFLLEEIDKIRDVPSKITAHISKKHYLHATQLLAKSMAMATGCLKDVGALTDVFAELRNKSKQLNSVLMNELSRQLYRNPSQQAETFRRQGSGIRGSGRAKAPLPLKKGVDIGPNLIMSPSVHPDEAYSSLSEDLNNDNPEQEPERFVSILAECLAQMGKLPEAVETIKVSMQIELAGVVNQTSAQLCASGMYQQGSAMLLELLSTLFDQFRAIVAAHSSALQSLRRAAEKYKIESRLYEVTEVWSNIQVVMEQLLENYLDMQNNSSKEIQQTERFSSGASNDLSAFFARRKQQKQKRVPLFRFDSSAHAKSFTSPHRESAPNSLCSNTKNMVCAADAKNIIVIFIPLMKFVEEIEQATGMHAVRNPCHLRGFIKEFVDQDFIPQQQMDVANKIDQVTRASDAWKAVTSAEQTAEMDLSRPLLLSCVNVQRHVQELHRVMGALPTYAELFLAVTCGRLTGYRETCQAAYRGIVQPDTEDRKFVSVDWLNDDDISRCLKFLPNWVDLQKQRKGRKQAASLDEEHPDDIKDKNLQEAEILVRNFGGRSIHSHEILNDLSQLKRLAQLQESMEWFAFKLTDMASGLPKIKPGAPPAPVAVGEIPPMQPKNVEDLEKLAAEFEELSNTCLLILHLEIRVQCFHYLLPGGYSVKAVNGLTSCEDLEPRVLQLSRAVNIFDEALSSTVQPNKAKYIFDGLGHLISKILITSVQYTNQLDESGVKKICRNILSLQQTLASVTMSREVGLDHARHYFELFYMTPEEVLVTVMEKGPQFLELEYMNALQLLHRNRGDSPTTINEHMKRLSVIMRKSDNVGVTV